MKDYIAIGIAVVALLLGVGYWVGDDNQSAVGGTRFPSGLSADGTAPTAGQIRGTTLLTTGAATFSGAATVSGLSTLSGGVVTDSDAITATTTLTSASANVQFLGTSANMVTITLPAATDGLGFKFVVVGALTGPTYLIDSAEGDNIEGSLRVNSALVACSGEDQINIVTDGENIGDWVELMSDGTSWYITGSNIETAAKFTCTDPS